MVDPVYKLWIKESKTIPGSIRAFDYEVPDDSKEPFLMLQMKGHNFWTEVYNLAVREYGEEYVFYTFGEREEEKR